MKNNKNMKITLLAELLDVSQVTLRRDLDNLENAGIVKRYHGYVSLDGADDTSKRLAFFYLIKKRIAKAASQMVEDGETIMLGSGTCCALFAGELASTNRNITIITNSIYIANYLRKFNVKIILLGGFYQPESQVLVGPIAAKHAREFYIEKFFLGTDGFVPDYGFTGGDCLRVETESGLVKCAEKVFILTESAKFQRRGVYNMIQFSEVTEVITDDGIPKNAEDILVINNIKLTKVPSAEERLKWCHLPGLPPILYKEKI